MLQTARFIHTGWQADSYREFISWLSSEGACSDDGICALLLRIAVAGDA